MGRPRTWTDEQFIEAVKGATSKTQIAHRLGLVQNGPQNRTFQAHANRLGLELPDGHKRDKFRGCNEPGCSSKHYARGFCASHYRQKRASGEIKPLRSSH